MLRAIDDPEFLSEAALALAELGPDDDVVRFAAEQLAALAPNTMVIAIGVDPQTHGPVLRAVVAPPDLAPAARELARVDLGRTLELEGAAHATLAESKLTRVAGGLHQLARGAPSVERARRIEHQVGIRAVFRQPFSHKGHLLGAVALASRAPGLARAHMIEIYVRLVAVALWRRRAEEELRESERQFRMLVENSRDVLFRLRVHPDLGLDYVCPAVEHVLGIPAPEMYADVRLGTPGLYPEAWLTEGVPDELPVEEVLARSQHRDGRVVWMEQKFTGTRDRHGKLVLVEGIAREVTRRKEAEDEIVAADRRKTEFLAVLSHELRNPLGAIRNATYVLGVAGARGDRGQRAIQVIERQIVQLTRLVDDLLDLARITRGKVQLHKEHLDVNALVRSLVDDYAALVERHGVTLELRAAPGDVGVFGDRTRISQVIDNLLNNAVKFTPHGGRITVTVELEAAAGHAVVRVHNTGSWIPDELRSRLFVPFVQAETTLDRTKGGLGLGLALIKGLLEMHGGEVAVDSDPASGTTFAIRLPLDPARFAAANQRAPATAVAAHRRVLVIEDNDDAAETMRSVLELEGHEVAIAHGGREGIELAPTFQPDLVVCDIGLPEMSGYDVARAFRADPALRAVPLVALTGYAGPDDIRLAREAGFDRHFSKPLALPAFERAIEELTATAPAR